MKRGVPRPRSRCTALFNRESKEATKNTYANQSIAELQSALRDNSTASSRATGSSGAAKAPIKVIITYRAAILLGLTSETIVHYYDVNKPTKEMPLTSPDQAQPKTTEQRAEGLADNGQMTSEDTIK